jgi:hypothetical protein
MNRKPPRDPLADAIHGPCDWPECTCADKWRHLCRFFDAVRERGSRTPRRSRPI